MKKIIGVSYTPLKMENYLSWFQRQGVEDEVEVVELSYLHHNVDDISRCLGFILTGGDDIDPVFYNGEAVYDNMPASFHTDRDVFEKKIVEFAAANNVPLLGICRGLQLVNVVNGGSLIQDAGPDGNKIHRSEAGKDKEHDVAIVRSSLLYEIAGTEKATVNSAHHQSAHQLKLGENLMVNALSNDGCIEGLEYADKQGRAFMMCVQWHPERMSDQQSPLSRNLLKALLYSIPST